MHIKGSKGYGMQRIYLHLMFYKTANTSLEIINMNCNTQLWLPVHSELYPYSDKTLRTSKTEGMMV